jgi:cleavage and polyadenylation specificity factor subunit 1
MQHVETITAEFLPDGNQLYFVVGDPEGLLHVMQYEPHSKCQGNLLESLTG